MKNKTINEIGFIKVRRCTVVINATKGKKVIYANKGKKVGVQYYFYHVGDILKSKEGKVFYKTSDKISGDI